MTSQRSARPTETARFGQRFVIDAEQAVPNSPPTPPQQAADAAGAFRKHTLRTRGIAPAWVAGKADHLLHDVACVGAGREPLRLSDRIARSALERGDPARHESGPDAGDGQR